MNQWIVNKIQEIQSVKSVHKENNSKLVVSTDSITESEKGDLITRMCQVLREEIGKKDIGIDVLGETKYLVERGVSGSAQEKFKKYAVFYGGVLGMRIEIISMVAGYPYEGENPREDSAAHLYNLGVDPMSDVKLEDISRVTGISEVEIIERYNNIEDSDIV